MEGRLVSGYQAVGDVSFGKVTGGKESTVVGFRLDSGRDRDGNHTRAGRIRLDLGGLSTRHDEWFRFSIRGLAESGFSVREGKLFQRVEFFGGSQGASMGHVVKELDGQVELDRRDLGVNGIRKRQGGAAWRSFVFDFRIPFEGIDRLLMEVGFSDGKGRSEDGGFSVAEWSVTRLDRPFVASTKGDSMESMDVDVARLIPLGGRWHYLPLEAEAGASVKGRRFSKDELDRLYYRAAGWQRPFHGHGYSRLQAGQLDLEGDLVEREETVAGLIVEFSDTQMVLYSRNLPDHPTASFPGYLRNPHYIQEQRHVWRLPLDPQPSRDAVSMDQGNTNGALNMGPVGVAVNGVVFFNPFDMGMSEAVDIMDRCCGHPGPLNDYHYHKYPICVRSPFSDDGGQHSPLIGWAFDGFPIYGPYEGKERMAKDDGSNPLNAFNIHHDPERGWHYHVTPGEFPYIIGGYWGGFVEGKRGFGRGRRPEPRRGTL